MTRLELKVTNFVKLINENFKDEDGNAVYYDWRVVQIIIAFQKKLGRKQKIKNYINLLNKNEKQQHRVRIRKFCQREDW